MLRRLYRRGANLLHCRSPFYLCLEHVDNLGAYTASRPETGLLIPSDNTWAAFQGRKKLNVSWDNGPNASYNSNAYQKELQETAHQPSKVIRAHGDVESEFAKGG